MKKIVFLGLVLLGIATFAKTPDMNGEAEIGTNYLSCGPSTVIAISDTTDNRGRKTGGKTFTIRATECNVDGYTNQHGHDYKNVLIDIGNVNPNLARKLRNRTNWRIGVHVMADDYGIWESVTRKLYVWAANGEIFVDNLDINY